MHEPTRYPGDVSIATYNIHSGRGQDGQRDAARIAEVIREIDADIVALQEVDWRDAPDVFARTQADYFAGLADYQAVAGPNIRDHRGRYGNVLLSRLPVLWHRLHDLTVGSREPRGAVEALLDANGKPIRVVATHFGLRIGERRKQASQTGAIVARLPRMPTILAGDLNEWHPGSPSLTALRRWFARSGAPRSFPSQRPVFRLDRVMMRHALPASTIAIHASPLARLASDHLPVRAAIVLPQNA